MQNMEDELTFLREDEFLGVKIHPDMLRMAINDPQMFPHLQVIAAHFGGWSVFDLAYECLIDTGCFVDTCSCSPFLSREEMMRHIREYGADRVLFGTDFPIREHETEVRVIDSLPLTDDETEKIFCGNALRFLKEKSIDNLCVSCYTVSD